MTKEEILAGFDPGFYKNFSNLLRPTFDVMTDFSIENPHMVPNTGPGIVVCNHKSDMDPFLILSNIKRPIHWFAGSYLYNIPVWGGIMKKLGAIPVSKDKEEIKAAFEIAGEILEDGGLVGVFPEGWEYISEGRFNAPIGRFQTGFVRLAVQSGAPIIPMALVPIRARAESQPLPPWIRKLLEFPYELQYNPSRLAFQKVHLLVGRPLTIPRPEGKLSHEFLTEWAETARSAVVALEASVTSRRILALKEEGVKQIDTLNPLEGRMEYFLDRLADNPGELRGLLEYQAGPTVIEAMGRMAERMASHKEEEDDLASLLEASMLMGWLARMEVEAEMPKHPVADPGTSGDRKSMHKLLMRLLQPKKEEPPLEDDMGVVLDVESTPALPEPEAEAPAAES